MQSKHIDFFHCFFTKNAVKAVFIFGILIGNTSFGQHPILSSYPLSLQHIIPMQSTYPPLSTDMPFDVLVGYIYFDSLSRSYNNHQLDSFVATLGNSDTLKQSLKYCYKLMDFDPIRFYQFIYGFAPNRARKVQPSSIFSKLIEKASAIVQDTHKVSGLCESWYILHIRVIDTVNFNDTITPGFLDKQILVRAEILDTIKGKKFIDCGISTSPTYSEQIQSFSNCVKFEYRRRWQERIKSSSFIFNPTTGYDTSGSSWIKKDHEYIVFLGYKSLGKDSLGYHGVLYPGLEFSSTIGVYPINSEGEVIDESNDFGFGVAVNNQLFKNKLRQRIEKILSLQY